MSIRPTERKDYAYSSVEAPLTDIELKTKEAKNRYYKIILIIGIDYFFSSLIIINESYFFNDKENEILLFIIQVSCFTVFLLFIIISLLFLNKQFTKIVKYIYILVLALYYIFELFWQIRYLVQYFDDAKWLDMVFLVITLLIIIPRLIVYHFINLLIIKINEIEDCKKGEEHDQFRQNLENKMERGENTNWSKTSLSSERKQQSQFLSGTGNKHNKLNSQGNVYPIKENYIEEDKENENNEND